MKRGNKKSKYNKSQEADSSEKSKTSKRQKVEEEDKDHEEKEQDHEEKEEEVDENPFGGEPSATYKKFDIINDDDFEDDDEDDDIGETEGQVRIEMQNMHRSLEERRRNRKNQFKLGAQIARIQQRMTGSQENTKFDTLFRDLEASDFDSIRNTISILNTELCMANETMKHQIQPERFVKPLLNQLSNGFDPSVMILASTCLLTLTDLLPEISEIIIDEGGLKILEEKGKNFEYIDVAED